MENIQKIIPTPEELAAEQAGLQVPKEEEIRTNVIAEFGFDEELDAEKIDKAVEKEMKHRKDISTAIGQKIKHRNEADELRKKVIEPPKESLEKPEELLSLKDIRALATVHDDDVDFVTSWAKANKMDIDVALKDDDVKNVLSGRAERRKTAEATNTGGGRRGPTGVPDEALIDKANQGDLKDDEMQKAAKAIIEQRKKAARGQT